jgi:hypothetical protein
MAAGSAIAEGRVGRERRHRRGATLPNLDETGTGPGSTATWTGRFSCPPTTPRPGHEPDRFHPRRRISAGAGLLAPSQEPVAAGLPHDVEPRA